MATTSASREALEGGLRDVTSLSGVPEHRLYDAETAAWEKLQPAIKAAKADQAVLEGHPTDAVRAVLEFLVRWISKKKIIKNKILECFVILLGDPAWLGVSQRPPLKLQNELQDLFAGNDTMCKRLLEDPMEALLNAAKPVAAVLRVGPDEGNGIKRNLLSGARVMQQFDFTFPLPSTTGLDRDNATEGFKSFYAGVAGLNKVCAASDPSAAAKFAAESTEELAKFWPDILGFLASMRTERRSFVSQIKFVVLRLSDYVPSFRAAAEDVQIDFADSTRGSVVEGGPGVLDASAVGGGQYMCSTRTAGYPDVESTAVALAERLQQEFNEEDEKDNITEAMAVQLQKVFDDEENGRIGDEALARKLQREEMGPPQAKFQWMYADAQLMPGLHTFAALNPGRWSSFKEILALAAQLDAMKEKDSHRPIDMRSEGKKSSRKFASPSEAVAWLREESSETEGGEQTGLRAYLSCAP